MNLYFVYSIHAKHALTEKGNLAQGIFICIDKKVFYHRFVFNP